MIKSLCAGVAGTFTGILGVVQAKPVEIVESIVGKKEAPDSPSPLFSPSVVHDGLVFISGTGVHFKGNISEHTKAALDKMEQELKEAGSSMEHVLKVNVYLADLDYYDAMNDVYRGRFGDHPPVRTTVACYHGLPDEGLQIDCIAVLKDDDS